LLNETGLKWLMKNRISLKQCLRKLSQTYTFTKQLEHCSLQWTPPYLRLIS